MEKKDIKVKLSKRLSCVANMVTPGSKVADIGCDHGFTSIYLVQNNLAAKVIAMDIGKGPLERAKEHISEYGLDEVIETRLSDGMEKLTARDEIDTVLLSGMGGRLMIDIITAGLKRGLRCRELILQPQSQWEDLRIFLRKRSYQIIEEDMIEEEGKFYPVIKARQLEPCGEIEFWEKPVLEVEDYFGPLLLERKNLVLFTYLQKENKKFQSILETIEANGNADEAVSKRLALLKEAQSYFA